MGYNSDDLRYWVTVAKNNELCYTGNMGVQTAGIYSWHMGMVEIKQRNFWNVKSHSWWRNIGNKAAMSRCRFGC